MEVIGSFEVEMNTLFGFIFFSDYCSVAYRSCIKTCKLGIDSINISIQLLPPKILLLLQERPVNSLYIDFFRERVLI